MSKIDRERESRLLTKGDGGFSSYFSLFFECFGVDLLRRYFGFLYFDFSSSGEVVFRVEEHVEFSPALLHVR